MVVVVSKSLTTKALKKLLKPGEELTAVGITGGFSQRLVGTTTENRIIVARCAWLSNTPKSPEIDVPFSSVTQVDFLCSNIFGYLILEAQGKKMVFKLATSLLFDMIEEGFKMYSFITCENANAAPAYLCGETPELMFKIKEGILKMTEKSIIIINPGEKFQDVKVREKISIDDLRCVDCYPGKGIGEKYYLMLKTDTINETFKVGGTLSNMANYLPQKEAMSDSAADIIFKEILYRNPKARPSYMEPDETPVVTMRVAHSQIGALGGGSILRFTNKRLMELETGNNELKIKYSFNIGEINRTLLTTIEGSNSETYKFEVFTDAKKYTYFAPATYSYGYEAFKLIGEKIAKLNQ